MDSITLIGMPGVGKSTTGKLLARKAGFAFIDGDKYIEEMEGMSIRQIIDINGDNRFLKIEEQRILELLPLKKTILSPGGSIVYLPKLMNALKTSSTIIFLDLPLNLLINRRSDKKIKKIGMIGGNLKTLSEIYKERLPLYREYPNIRIACQGKSVTQIVEEIIGATNLISKQ